MTYQAIDIARHILNYCSNKAQPISNLKLQKILYFAWVDYYKRTKTALYLDEICAWQLGPVIPNVYYEYCSHAGRPIITSYCVEIGNNDRSMLDEIIGQYINISASALVDRTHQPNKPWSEIYRNGLGIRDVIPFSLIKSLEC